jgi:hypothetical protein
VFTLLLFNRLHKIGALPSSSHTCLIDGDLYEPSAEPRFTTKLANVLKRLEHGLLSAIFSIGVVAKKRQRGGIHTSFVWPYQLIKCLVLAIPDALDQPLFVILLGWMFQRSRSCGHSPSLQDSESLVYNCYFATYSGSFFQPVSMETKLFQPCRTTITRCPKTNASIAHMMMKCHKRA